MIDFFKIQWSAPPNIHALTTTRVGGTSVGTYNGLNLANHVGDDEVNVQKNREILADELNLSEQPNWLNQTHSTKIVAADQIDKITDADGSYTTKTDCICAVLTADCLPVFMADKNGECVGVFHAGWRGLANGILENAVLSMKTHSQDRLIAAIGPSISQASFEVGTEVKQAFCSNNLDNHRFFIKSNKEGHFYADLYGLAKQQLLSQGVQSVWMDESVCTFKDFGRFYSYRRDAQTGRMASLIWLSR